MDGMVEMGLVVLVIADLSMGTYPIQQANGEDL